MLFLNKILSDNLFCCLAHLKYFSYLCSQSLTNLKTKLYDERDNYYQK